MPCSSLGHHSLYSTFGQILKGTPPIPLTCHARCSAW